MNTFQSLRPASGSTRRVWDIADELTRSQGRLARRRDVLERFVAEGGNPNTGSTQYHYWRSAQEATEPREPAKDLAPIRLTIGSDGRVLIPAEFREAMKLGDNGVVTAEIRDGELSIMSSAVALERARDLVRKFDNGHGSPVDELIAERKAEAERD